jgi:hypothetical protein
MTTVIDPRQRRTDHIEAALASHDGRQAQIHTAMPGTVVSYNPATNTVVVQPAIQGMRTRSDGSVHPVTIAQLHDVPVMFPGGGGHQLTFPIAAGDDCLVIFAERSIDFWFQLSGVQKPSDWRMHDINDGFALVGVRSQPKLPQAAISPDTVNLRSDDGKTVVQVDGPNNAVTVYAGTAGSPEAVVFVDGKNKQVIAKAGTATGFFDANTNTITMTAATVTINGELHVNGEIWGRFNTAPVSVTQHIHHNVGTPPAIGTE